MCRSVRRSGNSMSLMMAHWPLLFLFLHTVVALKQINELFGWSEIDFDFGDEYNRNAAIYSGEFVPANNVPVGVEVWREKVFISIPRRKSGIPATLAYFDLYGPNKSPPLIPFPSWSANDLISGSITSVYRTNVDTCDRLWIIDVGFGFDAANRQVTYPPKIIIVDLLTNEIIKIHNISPGEIKPDSLLVNIIVDVDSDCNNAYAYVTDSLGFGLIVYSLRDDISWRIRHSYHYPDPLGTDFNIGGFNFQWIDGILGVALAKNAPGQDKTLYFQSLSGTTAFAAPTTVLKDPRIANTSFHSYSVLGDRGTQAGASAYDEITGVLFYGLPNKNAVGCWNARKYPYESSVSTTDWVTQNNETLLYISDMRVDKSNNLWYISNRLPISLFTNLSTTDINFRVFSVPTSVAIQDTLCDHSRPKVYSFIKATQYYRPGPGPKFL